MSKCGQGGNCLKQDVDTKKYYCLDRWATRNNPKNMKKLQSWLRERAGKDEKWFGKAYVAETIKWNSTLDTFVQTGCSPNYMNGWWTLACCKHAMRRTSTFCDAIKNGNSVFIFTLSSKAGCDFQGLVSVAHIKHSKIFDGMQHYAEWICKKERNMRVKKSRLTSVAKDVDSWGWRFGDCHANDRGDLRRPRSQSHPHYDKDWQTDKDKNNINILATRDFLLYDRPTFLSCNTKGRSGYGFNWHSEAVIRKELVALTE